MLRGSNKADAGKELETQKEVVVSMLLRLIQYHQVGGAHGTRSVTQTGRWGGARHALCHTDGSWGGARHTLCYTDGSWGGRESQGTSPY